MNTPTRRLIATLLLMAPATCVPALLFEDPVIPIGSLTITVCRADFNGDGRPDVATANVTSRDVSVLLGDGNGDFLPESRVPGGSRAVLDLVRRCHGRRARRPGVRQPRLEPRRPAGGHPDRPRSRGRRVRGGDTPPRSLLRGAHRRCGRGRPAHLLASDDITNTIHVFRSLGGGAFAPAMETPVPSGAGSLGAADLNGDGHLDVAST